MNLDKPIIFRILLSVLLAGATLAVFLGRQKTDTPVAHVAPDILEVAQKIDVEVDTVLAHFRIEKNWTRRQELPIPNSNLRRVERHVLIPPDVQTVQMNVALNAMAHEYDGRAIASENLKANTVTIHIEVEGYIVQTIILKHSTELRRREPKQKMLQQS